MATAAVAQFDGRRTHMERKSGETLRARRREHRLGRISRRSVDALAPFVVVDGADNKGAAIGA